MTFEDLQISGPKKFFAAVKMQIISTILGVKITVFSQKWSLIGENLITNVKISDFDPKKVKNYFRNYLHLNGSEKLYQ